MDIFVKVEGQKIVLPTNMKVVTGSANFIRLIFTLTHDWDSMTVKAIFTQTVDGSETDTIRTLDSYDSCYIPSALLAGKCALTLYGEGVIDSSKKATTNTVVFILTEQGYASEGGSGDDDPSGDNPGGDGIIETQIATVNEVRAYLGIN